MNVRKPKFPVINEVCFRFCGVSALLVGVAALIRPRRPGDRVRERSDEPRARRCGQNALEFLLSGLVGAALGRRMPPVPEHVGEKTFASHGRVTTHMGT